MRLLLLLILMMSVACGKEPEKKTVQTPLLEQAKKKLEFYLSVMPSDDMLFPERCDKLTFKSYLAASIDRPIDLSGHMRSDGRLERDILPCYPLDSKSSISRDGVLAWLHVVLTTKDIRSLDRFISYGERNNWIVGEGPFDYTNMGLLLPTIYSIRGKLALTPSVDEVLAGFQGHLLAGYLWIRGRMNGGLGPVEMAALNRLYEASKTDPMYLALHHRFTDGNQDEALKILLDSEVFPDDRLSLETGVFGWGSQPALVAYAVTLAIIEGK